MSSQTAFSESRGSSESRDSHAAGPASSPELTVYFDGACPVCSREIAMYRRQPGAERCRWVDAARCPEDALGADLPRDAALARFHVRQADGRLVDGMRGFAVLWRTLPRTAWLGRLAGFGPVPALLDLGYRGFLTLRRAWRPAESGPVAAGAATPPWPPQTLADLRSDHAGEVGAVQIYRGILAVSRHPELRSFAQHHLATEETHLQLIGRLLPPAHRSRLLPGWRVAGWLTGALPALFGAGAVYATIAAVERFVDQHYAEQLLRIDTQLQGRGVDVHAAPSVSPERWAALRADLERCRLDEVAHRDDALARGPARGVLIGAWTWLVGTGSALAVGLARRI